MIRNNNGIYENCAESESGTVYQKNRTAYLGAYPASIDQCVTDTKGRTWRAEQKKDEKGLLWVEMEPPKQGRLF